MPAVNVNRSIDRRFAYGSTRHKCTFSECHHCLAWLDSVASRTARARCCGWARACCEDINAQRASGWRAAGSPGRTLCPARELIRAPVLQESSFFVLDLITQLKPSRLVLKGKRGIITSIFLFSQQSGNRQVRSAKPSLTDFGRSERRAKPSQEKSLGIITALGSTLVPNMVDPHQPENSRFEPFCLTVMGPNTRFHCDDNDDLSVTDRVSRVNVMMAGLTL